MRTMRHQRVWRQQRSAVDLWLWIRPPPTPHPTHSVHLFIIDYSGLGLALHPALDTALPTAPDTALDTGLDTARATKAPINSRAAATSPPTVGGCIS